MGRIVSKRVNFYDDGDDINFFLIDHLTLLTLHFPGALHFRSATDFEGGAFRLLSGAAASASLAEPDAGNTLSPSKIEQRRQMAEALLGPEHDAQGC